MSNASDQPFRPVYRVVFSDAVSWRRVEDTVALAILAVGCLHGEAAVRLEAGYSSNQDDRVIVLDAAGALSLSVAKVFVGMCTHQFGDRAFDVDRSRSRVTKSPSD